MVNSKGGIPIKKVFVLALLMASVTSFSKTIIPINVKGVFGLKTETNPLVSLISLEAEVEARAYDIKFTDIISMENNVGISTSLNANLPAKKPENNGAMRSVSNGDIKAFSSLGLEILAYYQPSVKFKVLDDLLLKVGLKVGTGATLGFDANSGIKYHGAYSTVVGSFIAGAEYKNIIIETELGADARLVLQNNDPVKAVSSTDSVSSEPDKILKARLVPDLKIKVGYRF